MGDHKLPKRVMLGELENAGHRGPEGWSRGEGREKIGVWKLAAEKKKQRRRTRLRLRLPQGDRRKLETSHSRLDWTSPRTLEAASAAPIGKTEKLEITVL